MTAIYKKELRSYFLTMTGYAMVGLFVFMTGAYFSLINIMGQVADYSFTLSNTSLLLLVIVPILTMRLFSEDNRYKTDVLLYTSPLSPGSIVLGKYFAAFTVFIIGVAITILFPVMLSFFGNLPVAKVAGLFLGYSLLGALFLAVGLFICLLIKNPFIAAAVTFCALLLCFLMDRLGALMPSDRIISLAFLCALAATFAVFVYEVTKKLVPAIISLAILGFGIGGFYAKMPEAFDGLLRRVVLWLSPLNRLSNFSKGVLSLADIVFYLSFTALFLIVAVLAASISRRSN